MLKTLRKKWLDRNVDSSRNSSDGELPYLGIRFPIEYHICNLKCPYCIASWTEKKNKFDIEKFRLAMSKIKQLPYRVCLRLGIGGEIFTSQSILGEVGKICNEDSNIFGVNFSSNLVADWDKTIKPFLSSVNTQKLGMGCTLHDSVIEDIDLFFNKVKKIHESGVLLYVGYVAVPQAIDRIAEYKRRCEEIGVPLILNSLQGSLKGFENADHEKIYPRDYTDSERQTLGLFWDTPHSYKLLIEASSPQGMQCSAGKNFIFIDRKGRVYPCNKIKKSIGSIYKGTIKFQKNDTICPSDRCWCGNQNQALRIVDGKYNRTRNLRIFTPKKGIPEAQLFEGYNPSIYQNMEDGK